MSDDKPVLLYDGDCGFCRRWIERWQAITGDAVAYEPSAKPEASVILVEPGGNKFYGAEAVFRSLARSPAHSWMSRLYYALPGAKVIAEACYRSVAANRAFFSFLSGLFWGKDVSRPSYSLARNFFLRGMGFVYFIAFGSLGVQIIGLSGSHGILPARDILAAVHEQAGSGRFLLLPTLAWLNTSDAFLKFLCWGGAAFSIFICFGVFPAFFLFLSWLFYLSLVGISGPFLSFQWDALLLETGFLAIFFAGPALRLKLAPAPRADAPRLLLKLLLFRLMFFSGIVKLASHDPAWRSLTALQYHYQTQPLPPWTAWYAHHWPARFQTASCLFVFAVELLAPFFIFFPRRLRHLSAVFLIVLQGLILLTGNYAFFNLLTLLLCLLLLEDSAWPRILRDKLERSGSRTTRTWPRPITAGLCALILTALFFRPAPLEPFCLVNHYGLFAVMTTERPEIILEGSADGNTWLPYGFKYKIGDVDRKPAFVAPHQPRLDWQMWFAALGTYRQNGWFMRMCAKILEGSPEVLALLEKNPFPEGPPRYLRALVYEYRFTSAAERKETGAWWHRELKGLYCPILERNGQP